MKLLFTLLPRKFFTSPQGNALVVDVCCAFVVVVVVLYVDRFESRICLIFYLQLICRFYCSDKGRISESFSKSSYRSRSRSPRRR